RLGGDDFDEILLDLARQTSGLPLPGSEGERICLLRECQQAKERLGPHRKKVFLDFSEVYPEAGEVTVPVPRFYEACHPLIQRTLAALERAIEMAASGGEDPAAMLAAIYLTGGSSDFPPIEWLIREKYGRRVRKSPYPHAATAIGLAVAADHEAGMGVRDRLSRNFGVWREEDGGRRKVIDLIFSSDTPITPGTPGSAVLRRYHPTHNVGHFRFQEFSALGATGLPTGNVSVWSEIFFPFDPALRHETGLGATAVRPAPQLAHQVIEETYTCDSAGEIRVEIFNRSAGYGRSYSLRPTRSSAT
ncbi:MAG TPA: Hsp70 family protein, partial [Candidatus Aminicenantes bacterium]|nr:Hsp70 family protein [Candidatus Aminicenantes bacterium]